MRWMKPKLFLIFIRIHDSDWICPSCLQRCKWKAENSTGLLWWAPAYKRDVLRRQWDLKVSLKIVHDFLYCMKAAHKLITPHHHCISDFSVNCLLLFLYSSFILKKKIVYVFSFEKLKSLKSSLFFCLFNFSCRTPFVPNTDSLLRIKPASAWDDFSVFYFFFKIRWKGRTEY